MNSQIMGSFMVFVGAVEQRLRGDTADIETGSAIDTFAFAVLPFFDTGGFQAQLRSADRRDITGRTTADNNYVVLFGITHNRPLFDWRGARIRFPTES